MDEKLREQFEVRRSKENPTLFEIFLRGKKVYEWDDLINENAPEDLVWNREIRDLFFNAVGIGLHLAVLSFKETIEDEQHVRVDEIAKSLTKINALKDLTRSITINTGKDFSCTPGARYKSDGPFSGEEFRENLLEKHFENKNDGTPVVVMLDGTQKGTLLRS